MESKLSTKISRATDTTSTAVLSPDIDYQWTYKATVIEEDGKRTEKSCHYVCKKKFGERLLSLSSAESLQEKRIAENGEDERRRKMFQYNSPSSFPGHGYEKPNVAKEKHDQDQRNQKEQRPKENVAPRQERRREEKSDSKPEDDSDSSYVKAKQKQHAQKLRKDTNQFRHGCYYFCQCPCHRRQWPFCQSNVRTAKKRQRDDGRKSSSQRTSATKPTKSKQKSVDTPPKKVKTGRAKFFVDDETEEPRKPIKKGRAKFFTDDIDEKPDVGSASGSGSGEIDDGTFQGSSADLMKSQVGDHPYQKFSMPENYRPEKKKR